jgi:cytochrome P450
LFYTLSKNLDVQQKLRTEIQDYLRKNDEISYDMVATASKLPYLDRVIQEVMRMNILGPALDRLCSKKDGYSLEPYSDFVIPPGMAVFIPSYAIMHDEKYFNNPWSFNPDRSSNDISSSLNFSFGCGPRSCIGERMALMVLKTAIINVLKDFRVAMNENTPDKLTINNRAYMLQYNENLTVDFIKDPVLIQFCIPVNSSQKNIK